MWACGGVTPPVPDQAPTITISGVADGEVTTEPVTITISVDRGTYSALLNGQTFFSGRTVTTPDTYILVVTAVSGTATATASLQFTIALGGGTRLIVRVMDLGQNEAGGGGDAILLTDSSSAGMRHVLLDAGPAGVAGADPGFVARRLGQLSVDTLEALVLSHAHSDHFGGMLDVLQSVVVRRFLYNGQVRTLPSYNQVLAIANQLADTVIVPSGIVDLDVGFGTAATRVSVLTPLSTYLSNANATSPEINEGSLGTEVQKGSFRLFLAGDGEVLANLRWRNAFSSATGGVTALKIGHHGGNDAMFDNGFSGISSWLAHTAPELALVSANGTSHPRQNALAALRARPNLITYCTNTHGNIAVRINEFGVHAVAVERSAAAACQAGTDAST